MKDAQLEVVFAQVDYPDQEFVGLYDPRTGMIVDADTCEPTSDLRIYRALLVRFSWDPPAWQE